jgi:hypothetical protein
VDVVEKRVMKQKLVTIYLDNMVYAKSKMLVGSFADKHGFVEEHLQTYLEDGWRVTSVSGIGGSRDLAARGWFAVILEK